MFDCVSLQIDMRIHVQLTSLERAKKIDDLEKRLVESEMLRMRFARKVTVLKEQVKKKIYTSVKHLLNRFYFQHESICVHGEYYNNWLGKV